MITSTVRVSSFRVLVAAGLLSASTACNQSDAQAAAQPTGEEPAANNADVQTEKAPQAEATPERVESSYDEDAFIVKLDGPTEAKVGETLTFHIQLSAKNGFKVNQEYPVKFRFADMPGLAPKAEVVDKEQAKVEKTSIEIPAQIVVEKAGTYQMQGKLSFSVCTEDRCLIEKRDLGLTINAS